MVAEKKNNTPNVPALRFPEFSGEWETFQLTDLASFSKERVKIESLSIDNYVSTENMQQDFAGIKEAISLPSSGSAIEFQVGDILISNIRPYLKKVWLADRNGGCSTDVLSLRTKNEKVDSAFLYCCLANDAFIAYVMSGAKGVKMPRGDKQHISSFSLGVPSIKEQCSSGLIGKSISITSCGKCLTWKTSTENIEFFNFSKVFFRSNVANNFLAWVILLKNLNCVRFYFGGEDTFCFKPGFFCRLFNPQSNASNTCK